MVDDFDPALTQRFDHWIGWVRMYHDACIDRRDVAAHRRLKDMAWDKYVGELLTMEPIK